MEKLYNTSLFIFRRDLRIEDNTGLIYALKNSESVICAFIFTPEQILHNPYRSDHCLQFMIESLCDLEEQLSAKNGKLFYFHGEPESIVLKCIRNLHIDALIINRDYTPYSQKRDKKLEKVCKSHKMAFHSFDDALLHPPEETVKKNHRPYTIFTPYFNNASKLKVDPSVQNRSTNYYRKAISFAEHTSYPKKLLPKSLNSPFTGGRKQALKILKNISSFSKYAKLRDFPAEDATTHLSAHLKFTTCSPREAYAAMCDGLSKHHPLVRSLYWRDFFTGIAYFFPHVFKGAFHPKYDRLKWSYSKKAFQHWCEGRTGFPIVDAGMRELNETGFMHNRVRMIAGSFLVKDLHIDWRKGEKYFAQKLIDYDPSVNNGNWQWVASTGCDAQPYFRIFNPWRQQEKFDPDCEYIKKWIPELKKLTSKAIHSWHDEQHHAECSKYPPPIVEHEKEAKNTLSAYRSV